MQSWLDYGKTDGRLYFWRTKAGIEVDFVVYGNRCFWAIEVKSSTTIRMAELRPLKAFLDDYPEATAFFLYGGKETLRQERILCLPVEKFLKKLNPAETLTEQSFIDSQ